MTTEENKAIVRSFYKAFEANDIEAITELLSPDIVAYSHGSPEPQNREMHLQGIRMWNEAFGETYFSIEEQIGEGDKVATYVTMRSTHNRGDFLGLSPTGKQVVISAVSIEIVKDGKISKRRVSGDWTSLMLQLDLDPQELTAE